MHSIYVSVIEPTGRRNVSLLAVDIDNERSARGIVRGIATSFRRHGSNANERGYWFQSGRGLREIWCERDGMPREKALRRSDARPPVPDARRRAVARPTADERAGAGAVPRETPTRRSTHPADDGAGTAFLGERKRVRS